LGARTRLKVKLCDTKEGKLSGGGGKWGKNLRTSKTGIRRKELGRIPSDCKGKEGEKRGGAKKSALSKAKVRGKN